jgi:hypothetical protein
MWRLHKKKSNTNLFMSYCNSEVAGDRQRPETEGKIPQGSIIENDHSCLEKEHIHEDINIGAEQGEWDVSEDKATLCTVTMLGVVMQLRPRLEGIKEICFQSPRDYKITTAIYMCANCTKRALRSRYPESLFIIWLKQLRESGFWNGTAQLDY